MRVAAAIISPHRFLPTLSVAGADLRLSAALRGRLVGIPEAFQGDTTACLPGVRSPISRTCHERSSDWGYALPVSIPAPVPRRSSVNDTSDRSQVR